VPRVCPRTELAMHALEVQELRGEVGLRLDGKCAALHNHSEVATQTRDGVAQRRLVARGSANLLHRRAHAMNTAAQMTSVREGRRGAPPAMRPHRRRTCRPARAS
jgi:hypothetical protein